MVGRLSSLLTLVRRRLEDGQERGSFRVLQTRGFLKRWVSRFLPSCSRSCLEPDLSEFSQALSVLVSVKVIQDKAARVEGTSNSDAFQLCQIHKEASVEKYSVLAT